MNKEVYGIIYKIQNKINNKVYIGQTIRKNGFKGRYKGKGEGIERVLNTFIGNIKYNEPYNKHLYLSIKKYGTEAFEVDEKFDIAHTKEDLNEKEKYWIKHYNSTDEKYGYNITIGGDGNSRGISAYLSSLGKRFKPVFCIDTNEVFLTLSEAAKKTETSETTVKNVCLGISRGAYSKLYDKKLTFEYIDLNMKVAIPVICLTTNKIFKHPRDGAKYYKTHRSSIVKNCKGVIKSSGKHPETGEKLVWAFALQYKIESELT